MQVVAVSLFLLLTFSSQVVFAGVNTPVYFVCSNTVRYDIVALVRNNVTAHCDFEIALHAYKDSPKGAAILLLSDGQSEPTPFPTEKEQNIVIAKRLRVYVEFCNSPETYNKGNGGIQTTSLERIVVPNGSSLEGFKPMQILHPHVTNFTDLRLEKVGAFQTDLVLAKVAGFETAVYGLPSVTFPVLLTTVKMPSFLLSSIPLSMYVTARFSPASQFTKVWTSVLRKLGVPHGAFPALSQAVAAVRPSFSESQNLPGDAEAKAFERGLKFYLGMLPDSKTTAKLAMLRAKGGGVIGSPLLLPNLYTRSNFSLGRMGILEGFNSKIDFSGNQYVSTNLRNDCISETAMALAMGGYASSISNSALKRKFKSISRNLLDFPWFHGGFSQRWLPGVAPDPMGDAMGLLAWSSTTDASKLYYVDDCARSILAGFSTRALLQSDRWDSTIARAVLANLRMAGRSGFSAQNSYVFSDISSQSWEYFHDQNSSNNVRLYTPHYQSYIWAVFIRADGFLGNVGLPNGDDLYKLAANAISMMMLHYPKRWQNTANGITMQRARMLLPLSWLVRRAKDRGEERQSEMYTIWLNQVASGLLARQHENGAIYEEISAPGWGGKAKVPNNEDYGTFEAPLNQENTDPVSDLLYTSNFAFVGLHEAWHATGNVSYKESSDRLGQFLVRIQARAMRPKHSQQVWLDQWDHPELDGAFFRAFATNYWTYWASDADLGWGAWAVETGWSQSWITTVFGLRLRNISLWDLCSDGAANLADELRGWAPYYFGV